MPNTFWLKDLHLRALRFQFTLPPTTLGLCQYILRCLQDSATKVAFESYGSLLWSVLFRQSSGNFIPRISHDSKNWNPWFRLWPQQFFFRIDFQIHHVFTSMQSRPDSLRLVGRYQPSVQIHLQWNNHWSCFCRLQTFPADENRCGGPSASAVSSSDMSREVLCICLNTYVGYVFWLVLAAFI